MAYISQIKLSDTIYDISAIKLKNARTIFGKSFDGTGNVAGQPLVYGTYTSTAASRYANSGIQVRENGLVGSAQSDIGYAPSIGFHWSGRIAATMLFHSDGNFYLRKQDGTSRASLDANLIGNASTATKLATARTFTIGATSKTFDGSTNVSWTPYEMRVTRAQYNVGNNMNVIADHGCELGMAELNSGDTTIDPNAGTSWHHYINMTWNDAAGNNGTTTNEWCTQIANKAGTTDLWVRSRNGGSITDGTAWAAPWTRILTGSNYTNVLDSRYVNTSGDTMTGDLTLSGTGSQLLKAGSSTSWISGRDTALVRIPNYNAYNAITSMKTTNGSWEMGVYTNDYMYFTYCSDANYNAGTNSPTIQIKVTPTNGLYGAVWNDYAEFRNQIEEIKPGYCVASMDNGQVYKATEKLQACDGIVSDTFGFSIGETDECKTPLAVAGRVLAYCEGNRYDYHSGDTVCAGPEGKVCKMTREEIREWPDRIIGIVSEIPEYERWGTCDVLVDGRIWIKVK